MRSEDAGSSVPAKQPPCPPPTGRLTQGKELTPVERQRRPVSQTPRAYTEIVVPDQGDRPTVPPAFDVEKYAKDSDKRLATAARALEEDELPPESGARNTPTSEVRLATRPTMRAALTNEAWARGMKGVPVLAMSPDQIMRLPLDHRAGFLLSQMDGSVDIEMLLAIAGMPTDEALAMLRDFYESGIITFR
jgi:hypothetical protein